MIYSLVLIISLEAWVIYKYLSGITKKQSLLTSLKANLITVFFVTPLVWGLWLAVIMNLPKFMIPIFADNILGLIASSPWISDVDNILLAEWFMAPVYFVASYYIEYWSSRQKLKDFDQAQVKKAFFYANLYSYLMIMAFETIYQIIITPYKDPNLITW